MGFSSLVKFILITITLFLSAHTWAQNSNVALTELAAVVRVKYSNGEHGTCSGFFISPTKIATSAHCLFQSSDFSNFFNTAEQQADLVSAKKIRVSKLEIDSYGVVKKNKQYKIESYQSLINKDAVILKLNKAVKLKWFESSSNNKEIVTKSIAQLPKGGKFTLLDPSIILNKPNFLYEFTDSPLLAQEEQLRSDIDDHLKKVNGALGKLVYNNFENLYYYIAEEISTNSFLNDYGRKGGSALLYIYQENVYLVGIWSQIMKINLYRVKDSYGLHTWFFQAL